MDTYAELTEEVRSEAKRMNEWIETYQKDMLAKIEQAKQDEVLSSLKSLSMRLDRIEESLKEKDQPAEQDEVNVDLPNRRNKL